MYKLVLTVAIIFLQRISCDEPGYGGRYGGKSKVEKASFGLTLDMEKEDVYLKKDPGQLVLVLGDSGKKKPEYSHKGDDEYQGDGGYKGGDEYHGGGGYTGGDEYHGGGGYGGGDDYHGSGGYQSSGYSGHGDGGYGDSGHGYGGDDGYKSSGGYSGGHDGGEYGGGQSVYLDSKYGGGNGLVVTTGKYMSPGEYSGGHGISSYSSKRYGTQKSRQMPPNYRKRRPINDLNYASNHNRYSVHKMNGFIPNDNQYYYYN